METLESFQVKDVFTPTTPARITFIDREEINDKLVRALQMPGKQLIVYGHSGSGKTTLLVNKLCQLYEKHITTRCMKGMTFEQIMLDAFDQLNPYYTSEHKVAEVNQKSSDLAGSYLLIKCKLNESEKTEQSKKEQRILPPQLTAQALGKFLGAKNCCWVIEDFHKIEAAEKTKLAQLMKVFMDLSDEYNELKIVAIGAVDTARQVVEYDDEMRNRVAEIHVALMTESEIESIISKGEQALNIIFGDDLKSLIAKYSNGLASVCHHLCMYMCEVAGINETSKTKISLDHSYFEKALKLYIEEASDSIKGAFDKALKQRRKNKFEHMKIVLETLCDFGERGASRIDLLTRIHKSEPNYPEASLKSTLQKLTTDDYGAIVRIDQTAGLNSFSDPFYRAYALTKFHKNKTTTKTSSITSSITNADIKIRQIEEITAEIMRNYKVLKTELSKIKI